MDRAHSLARMWKDQIMDARAFWVALALLGTPALVACEEKSGLEEAAEEVADEIDDAT
jgi:hypothetical protein